MELALQVVGLKMTGKIEDAKNVAMRIVGNASESSAELQNGHSGMMMQTAANATTTRDLRPLLFTRAGESEDFESLIVDFLAILDTPLDHPSANSISISEAISHQTGSGQTLLHLASFLGFELLLRFLVTHGVDVDARDRNGCTALHFAAISHSRNCVRVLLEAGADTEIVNALGKTPEEVGGSDLFKGIIPAIELAAQIGDSGDEVVNEEEAAWGDVDDDSDDIEVRPNLSRKGGRRTLRRGVVSSGRTPAPTSRPSTPTPILPALEKLADSDAKQTASFIDLIQRTLAQLPGHPQLPKPYLPNLPHLPEMPAVPWGALPQLPMVFPVFVPMWPAFLGGDTATGDKVEGDEAAKAVAAPIRAAQELRAMWEKWLMQAVAAAPPPQQRQAEDIPPPVFTPRTLKVGSPSQPEPEPETPGTGHQAESSSSPHRPIPSDTRSPVRRFRYGIPPVTEQEVNAFGYQRGANTQKKREVNLPVILAMLTSVTDDRMLLMFWLPILLSELSFPSL